jgi:hypothetical protein
MKWTGLATGLAVTLLAAACLAETPDWSGGGSATTPTLRGRMFGSQNWWTRFGEPVNATALAEQEPIKAGEAAPMPLHGDGYVYSPGACDYSPPCIDHLWNGYAQWPKRCNPYHGLFNRCGNGCDNGCGCGNMVGCGKGCGCAPSCTTKAGCGCSEPVGCTTAVGDCGCKPVCGACHSFHLCDKWRCFTAHWHRSCDSCSAPISCGCSTPVSNMMPSEKQSTMRPPTPLPEEASLIRLPRMK